MKTDREQYSAMVEAANPKSSLAKNCLWDFMVGGAKCTLGELLFRFYKNMGFIISDARLMASISLVALSAFCTAMGWYGRLAKRAGAGTLVPITGFANAVVSPAMEFRAEGLITGTATKMFAIAGPVIVYGVLASVVYGVILFFKQTFVG
ncbi:MAG: SpoVA/SpoVAEb family sporulation membrane protein [Oscillospiraceae bacterium]|nr:SpoVA/SpoVAEb family sporulation membrane protein [Oscillospiraceae bacterium]